MRTARTLVLSCLVALAADIAIGQNPPQRRGDPGPRPGAGSQPLPEPATMVLLGLGVGGAGIALVRRRRKGAVKDTEVS